MFVFLQFLKIARNLDEKHIWYGQLSADEYLLIVCQLVWSHAAKRTGHLRVKQRGVCGTCSVRESNSVSDRTAVGRQTPAGLHRVSQLFLAPRPGPEWISCSHWVTAAPCLFTACWTAVAAAASVPVRHSSRGRVSAEARLMAQLFNPAVKRLLLNWHLLRWIFDQFHQRLMGIDGSKGRDRTICGNQWSLGRRTRVPLFVLVKTSAL